MNNRVEAKPETTTYPAEWSTWTRRVAVVVLLVGLVMVAILFGPVLQSTILALLLAYVLYFPVRFLTRRARFPYALAALLVFLVYLVIVIALILNLAPPVTNFISILAQEIQIGLVELMEFLETYTPDQGWLVNDNSGQRIANLNFIYQPLSNLVKGQAGEQNVQGLVNSVGFVLGTVTGTIGAIGAALGRGLLVNLLALIFLLEVPAASNWLVKILPATYQREYGILGGRIARKWNGYFRATVTVAVVLGVLNGLQTALLGIPGAPIVGLLSAFFGLIPILGGLLSIVTISLVALLQGSTSLNLDPLSLALLAVGINLVIQAIIWNVVFPILSGEAVALPLVVVVLGIVVGTAVGGVLGALLVTPILGILREIVEYVLKKIGGGDPYPGEPEPAFLASGASGRAESQQQAAEGTP